jgi:arylsulfatase A-like enzyme
LDKPSLAQKKKQDEGGRVMKKWILAGFALLILGLGVAWTQRVEIVLALAERQKRDDIPANRPIAWMQGPATASSASPDRPPNIVFILVDDLGYNDISTFGGGMAGGKIKTPNIDALAASGAIFSQAYSGTGSCAPSRAMIMTGRYPTRTGFEFTPTPDGMSRALKMAADAGRGESGLPATILHSDRISAMPKFDQQGLPGSEVTIAEVLKAKGYHTVHIGKWHTGLGPEFGANAQGFDESLLMASGLYLPEDDPNVVNARLDFDPIDRFLWARMEFAASYNDPVAQTKQANWFKPGGYLTDYWTDEAINVIRANKNRPFFLNLAHWGVHSPLQATKADYDAVGDIGNHRERVYAAMITALDRSVGRVVAELKAQGLADNTMIVFSSDNGGPGYIGIPDINKPYRGWKLTLFEGGIRVPMFVAWPGKIAAGTTINAPVAHIDLMPTFAAAAGAPLPQGVAIDGVDILPWATGKAKTQRPHQTLFWQSAGYQVVRDGDWKLQLTDRPQKAWLFNLGDDPTEQRDLAASNPDKVAQLRALITAHRATARAPLYPAALEAPVAIDKTLDQKVVRGDRLVFWPN